MFKNMKIGARLGMGFGIVILFFVLTTVIVSFSLSGSRKMADESLPYALLADEMAFNTVQVQQFLTDVSATHNPGGYKEAENAALIFRKDADTFREIFKKENNTEALKNLEDLQQGFDRFYDTGRMMADTYVTKGLAAGNKIMEEFDRTSLEMTAKIKKFQQRHLEAAKANTQNVVATLSRAQKVMVFFGLLAIVLGSLTAFYITRSIRRPLEETVTIAKSIAGGDLTMKIGETGRDETGQMLEAMKDMATNLKDIIYKNKVISGGVSHAADQISEGNQDFAQRIAGQSASIQETSATMEEMSASIKLTSDNTEQILKIK